MCQSNKTQIIEFVVVVTYIILHIIKKRLTYIHLCQHSPPPYFNIFTNRRIQVKIYFCSHTLNCYYTS